MFRWFSAPKKKEDTDEDEFVILDVYTPSSPDVTPDILSDVTSVPEYTCTLYPQDELQYDFSRIEIITDKSDSSTTSESSITSESNDVTIEIEEELSEYNYDDVEDITAEINAMDAESFYRQIEWKNWNQHNTEAILTPDFQIIPNPDEDFAEKGIRNMFEFIFSMDILFEELVKERFL